ncbi:MAG: hypothetical protein DI624_01650 [Brevundimonas sp.]|nr:MAG: hypothetical protein DI624_01650 [Brevundimonas sp.]
MVTPLEKPGIRIADLMAEKIDEPMPPPDPDPEPPNSMSARGSVMPRRTEIDSRSARICLATDEKVSPRLLVFMMASTMPLLSASRPRAPTFS